MTVYFAFVPSAGNGSWPVRMEFAPNLEVPQHALKQRARLGKSRTYYDGIVRGKQGPQPVEDFPGDMSAFMLVWRRRSAAPVPGMAETPDEVWSLTALGAVVREKYADVEPEEFRPAPLREWKRPGATPRPPRPVEVDEELPTMRRVWLAPTDGGDVVMVRELVKPPRPACGACDVVPDLRGFCGCS
ncbi:hypothetical protein ABZT26_36135 [Streptomyces sp. NPDC005395]|uniref:hypothetical protein n=1 Tax=Streptomyces sp. NPDC005395 TaxID=3157042 RepID=UPI0033BF14A4